MIKKIFNFLKENILFVQTLFLLAFIPLYPKLPLINVTHTWVYIRAEDFVIVLVLLTWFALLVRKKVSLKTPLTFPIFIFWIIGLIATLNGILLIFPTLSNVFPNVAFLSAIRHIEYLSLFFVAFSAMKDKKFLKFVIITIVATLIGVIVYGFGQKYLGFPAFLTSNEEFAKGIPIQLSQLSRLPSTFAGQYDLAAYLVLIIPIIVSLFFGIKNILVKLFLIVTTLFSFVLLFWTVSRISFFVAFVTLGLVLLFQKRKLALISIPIIILFAVALLSFRPALLDRFKSTVSDVDVLVDAKTGDSVGHVKFVPRDYFKDKLVLTKSVVSKDELTNALEGQLSDSSTSSGIMPFNLIPSQVALVEAVNLSTGESLPQGTGYVNLALSPVVKRVDNFFYEFPPNVKSSPSAQFVVLNGNFIIKKAAAYDLSFTTRFQGEWPRAIDAFEKNVLFGSGYSSVTLAVDNNYLRMLAEVGLVGFIGFVAIFLSFGIYLKRGWKDIPSGIEKSFLVGFAAGIVGLFLNATLIDVFEASKVAYVLWLLMGVSFGLIVLYFKNNVNLTLELKKLATSSYAFVLYFFALIFVLYFSSASNFFIGDDFTWLRWAAQAPANLLTYFTQSDGFFYRPGTKIYFYIMYHLFWLSPIAYHLVSLVLHFIVATLFFLLMKKLFKNTFVAASCAFIFIILSGYTEIIFWISTTGYLFNVMFGLLGLLLFIKWDETRKIYYYLFSIIGFSLALLFHELGVVLPLLVLAYKSKDGLNELKKTIFRKDFLVLFIPVIIYLIVRLLTNSHWFNGDYSYNLLKLPFNFVGNALGYLAVIVLGPNAISFYEKLRTLTKEHLFISMVLIVILAGLLARFYKTILSIFKNDEKQIISFSLIFFFVALLPFIGLGNLTSRYSYLATMGIIPLFVIFVKRLYGFLLSSGKNVAVAAVLIFVLSFSMFNIVSMQQTFADWAGAGVKVNNFFVSFDSLYSNYWTTDSVELHFVNVPITYGQAWVFPVGLQDAVWFAVKNDRNKISQDPDLQTALSLARKSPYNKVLLFNDDGSLSDISLKTGKPIKQK